MNSDSAVTGIRAYSDPASMRERIIRARAQMLALMDRMRDPQTLQSARLAIEECDALLRDLDGHPEQRSC